LKKEFKWYNYHKKFKIKFFFFKKAKVKKAKVVDIITVPIDTENDT